MKPLGITQKENEQSIDFWNESSSKTNNNYMLVYLEIDVLLSVDVIEKLTNLCMEYYKIDPYYTYANPGLTWSCG